MSAAVLEARAIAKRFGGVVALQDVSFGLAAGSCSNTSSPAPAISPAEIIRINAFSSITSPRAVLTT